MSFHYMFTYTCMQYSYNFSVVAVHPVTKSNRFYHNLLFPDRAHGPSITGNQWFQAPPKN
ncbi:unnamed protein product [Ixodes persulcatus]